MLSIQRSLFQPAAGQSMPIFFVQNSYTGGIFINDTSCTRVFSPGLCVFRDDGLINVPPHLLQPA